MTNPSVLRPCTRPARFIILRCGSVQSFFLVSSRMFAHSRADGRWRFSGLAVPERGAFGQPQFRPSSTRLPLLAGQPVPQGVDQVIVRELVVCARSAVVCLILRVDGTFRVGGRDQAKLRVEDVDQVVEVPGAVRIPRCFEQFLARSHLPLDVGAALGQESFQHRLGGFLVKAMLGRGGRGAEGLFEERHTDSLRAAHLPERGRGPGLAFHHLGEESQPHRDDLAVLGKPDNRLDPEMHSWSPAEIADVARASRRRPGRMPSAPFWAWRGSKRSTSGDVLALEQSDLQVPHEPAGRQPEIIPHHHDRLDMLAIALTKGGDQFRVLLTSLGMEPLLELIQDQQHLALGWQDAAPPQACQRIDQPQSSRQFRTDLAQALEQPSFGLLRGRLDVNRQDVLAEPGQKSRLDQR